MAALPRPQSPANARRAAFALAGGLLLGLLPLGGAAAASPPVINAAAPTLTIDEFTVARHDGTWSDADADEVVVTASVGNVTTHGDGRWSWTHPFGDGPDEVVVTFTATDSDGQTDSVDVTVTIENVPPFALTRGPAFVPVSATAERYFEWRVGDVNGDNPVPTATCGSGTVVETGVANTDSVVYMRCRFTTAGSTLVGVQVTDKDGATTDGRIPVVATTAVKSMLDGRLVVTGPYAQQTTGGALAAVDLDADGKADIVIGSTMEQWYLPADPGTVPVIRGRADAVDLELGALPGGSSWTLSGPPDARFGSTLAAAGDVNGDGRGDLLIGSLGTAWVVFARSGFGSLDVRTMPAAHGFEITGFPSYTTGPQTLAGVGDVNGDGFDDIALGAPNANGGDGEVAVLLGSASPTDVDASAIPAGRGFTIESNARETGVSVAGGDVNGDGLSDVAVASPGGWSSNVLVAFGSTTPVDVDQSTMTAGQGFTIGGGEGLAASTVAAGDLDRDGFADVAFTYVSTDGSGMTHSRAMIVRGGATNASVPYVSAATGSRFARIAMGDAAPPTRLATVDLTDDGYAELVIGGPSGGMTVSSLHGSTHVIRGGSTIPNLDLGVLHARWSRIDGDVTSAWAGAGLAAGDVTGDGIPDLVIGADGAIQWNGDWGGRVAVFPGTGSGDNTAPSATAPIAHLAKAGRVTTGIPVRLTWTGSDAGTGIARFELQRKIDDGPWVAIRGIRGTTTNLQVLAGGHTYRFRVRAQDGSGNWSAWKYGTSFSLTGLAESSPRLAYSGSWSTSIWSVWWGGRARYSTDPGASVTLTFTGRELIWVGGRDLERGTARIYVNGVLERTVGFSSFDREHGVIVWQKAWSTVATRTVRIVVWPDGPWRRVDVDGFAVLR